MIDMIPEENKNNEVVQAVPFEKKDINLGEIRTDIITMEEVPELKNNIDNNEDECIKDDIEAPIPVEDYIFNLEVNIKALNTTLEERDQELKNLKENYNILKDNLENKLYEKSFNSTINKLSQALEQKNQQNINMEQMISSLHSTLHLKDETIAEMTKEFDKQLEMEILTAKMAISNLSDELRYLKEITNEKARVNDKLLKQLDCIDFIIKSK
jgi:hypothetical protein